MPHDFEEFGIRWDLANGEEKDLDSEYSLLVYILVKTEFSVGGF
jgi:hypothetical protein